MKELNLKKFQDEDIQLFENWLRQDFILKWYHEPEEWLREAKEYQGEFHWISRFIVMDEETPMGFCQFYKYEDGKETWNGTIPLEGTYSIDYLIGEKEYIGKGCGRQIINLLIEKIFRETEGERIIAQPEPENAASCRTLLSCGFSFDEKNQLYIKVR